MTVDEWVVQSYPRGVVHRGVRCRVVRYWLAADGRGVWFVVDFPGGGGCDRCYRKLPKKVRIPLADSTNEYHPGMTYLQKAAVDHAQQCLNNFLSAVALVEKSLGGRSSTDTWLEANQYANDHVMEDYLSDGMVYESVQQAVAALDWLANYDGRFSKEVEQ